MITIKYTPNDASKVPDYLGYVTITIADTRVNRDLATRLGWLEIIDFVYAKNFHASPRAMPQFFQVHSIIPLAAQFEHEWAMVWQEAELITYDTDFPFPSDAISETTILLRGQYDEPGLEAPHYQPKKELIVQKVTVMEDEDTGENEGELLWYVDPFGWVHCTVFYPDKTPVLSADFKPHDPDVRVRAATTEDGQYQRFGRRHVEVLTKALSAYYKDGEVWDMVKSVKDLAHPMEVRWEIVLREIRECGIYPSLTHVDGKTFEEWKDWIRQHPALTPEYDDDSFEVFTTVVTQQLKGANAHALATKPVVFTLNFDKEN